MKHVYTQLAFVASLLLAGACSDDDSPFAHSGYEEEGTTQPTEGIVVLSGTESRKIGQILNKLDPATQCMDFGYMTISEEENAEIAAFTTQLLADQKATTERQKFDRIFQWVSTEIKYEQSDPEPYAVFKNRKAVCQGYANLMRVMCIAQNIPVVAVNGWIDGAGHAWLYCLVEGKWIVSDPTNGHTFEMEKWDTYEKHLVPTEADLDIAQEKGFVCNYYESQYNLKSIPEGSASVTLPENIGGIRVTSFIPRTDLPSGTEEIHIGQNITSLGHNYLGLKHHGKNIRSVTINENNPKLETYKGVVYQKYIEKGYIPYYVPNMIEEITLRPMKVMEKNILTYLPNLKRLYVADGTETIEDWAVENCPQLIEIHLPASVTSIAKEAFAKVHPDCKIIREKDEE